jgi:hypothetical protein
MILCVNDYSYIAKLKAVMDYEPSKEENYFKLQDSYVTHLNEFFLLLSLCFIVIFFLKIGGKLIKRSSFFMEVMAD